MAGSNFQDGVVLDGDTLAFKGEALSIGTGAGAKSLIVANDLGVVHYSISPAAGTVTVGLPAVAGTIAYKSDIPALSAGGASASNGTVVFSNSNNVSFGMNGSTITGSVAAGATATGNVGALAAGTQTAISGTIVFSDSNGISFGLSGSSRITASYTVPSTAGLLSAVNVSGGTTSNNLSALTFANANGVSFGLNASTLTGSVAAGATATGNLGALAGGTQTATSGTVVFSDSNGISFGLSGSTRMTASYTVPSTAGLISAVNVSAGTTSNNASALTFANANGVSFGLNASTITGSVAAGATATGNFGALAGGTQTATSGTVVFSDSNGISFGMSGSSRITASYTVPSTAGLISAVNVSAGTTSNNLSALTFGNANGVSFGLNASTVTGSVAAGATATGNFGALAGGTQTATSGTVVFSDSNGISFGLSGSSRITASYTVPSTAGLISAVNLSAGTTSSNVSAFVFSNSNNVSFGLNGATITASASGGGGGAAISAGTQSGNTGTVVFSDSNGVSFGMSGSSRITASIQAVRRFLDGNDDNITPDTDGVVKLSNTHGVSFYVSGGPGQPTMYASVGSGATATGNFGALAGGTQTATSGTVVFSDSNGISFGMSGSSRITASYTVPSTAGLISAINVSAGTTSNNASALTFGNANGVSFGLNASTITGSVAAGATATGNFGALAGGTQTATSGTVVFSDSNGISFGMSGSSRITASYTVPSTAGLISAVNFSAGTTSTNATGIVFSNSNGVSFGLNGGTITATIGAAPAAGIGAIAGGTQTATSGTVVFSDANGISFGLNGSTQMTANYEGVRLIQAGAPGVAFTSGSLYFQNSNNVTIGVTSNSLTFSASVPSSSFGLSAGTNSSSGGATFSDSNGVSFGMNTNGVVTASVNAGGGWTQSYWNPQDACLQVAGQQGNGTLHIQPGQAPDVQFDRVALAINWSGASNSTLTCSYTFAWGLYTRNDSSLSLLTAYTVSTTGSINHSGTVNTTLFNGPRLLTMGLTNTITAGQYWIGILSRSSTAGANGSFSQFLASQINSNFSGILGVASNATNQYTRGLGQYSATTTALPSSIAFSQIRGTASVALRQPVVYVVSGTIP